MEVVDDICAFQGSVDPCDFSDMAAVGDNDTSFVFVWPLELELGAALDLAYANSPALAAAAAASTTKLLSPRGQKRGRSSADDDAGGARGSPRRALGTVHEPVVATTPMGGKRDVSTQVCEADLLLPSVTRDVSTQFPEVEEERSVDADNPEWTLLGDFFQLPLELFPVGRTGEGRHCHGSVVPDAGGNVSEEELPLQQLYPDFTEAARDADFKDFFEDFCQRYC